MIITQKKGMGRHYHGEAKKKQKGGGRKGSRDKSSLYTKGEGLTKLAKKRRRPCNKGRGRGSERREGQGPRKNTFQCQERCVTISRDEKKSKYGKDQKRASPERSSAKSHIEPIGRKVTNPPGEKAQRGGNRQSHHNFPRTGLWGGSSRNTNGRRYTERQKGSRVSWGEAISISPERSIGELKI